MFIFNYVEIDLKLLLDYLTSFLFMKDLATLLLQWITKTTHSMDDFLLVTAAASLTTSTRMKNDPNQHHDKTIDINNDNDNTSKCSSISSTNSVINCPPVRIGAVYPLIPKSYNFSMDSLDAFDELMDHGYTVEVKDHNNNNNNNNNQCPKEGDTVEVEYQAMIWDGAQTTITEFEVTSSPVSFTVGAKEVIPGLDEAIKEVQIGIMVNIVIAPEKAYGSKWAKNRKIPPNSQIVYFLKLNKIGSKRGKLAGEIIQLNDNEITHDNHNNDHYNNNNNNDNENSGSNDGTFMKFPGTNNKAESKIKLDNSKNSSSHKNQHKFDRPLSRNRSLTNTDTIISAISNSSSIHDYTNDNNNDYTNDNKYDYNTTVNHQNGDDNQYNKFQPRHQFNKIAPALPPKRKVRKRYSSVPELPSRRDSTFTSDNNNHNNNNNNNQYQTKIKKQPPPIPKPGHRNKLNLSKSPPMIQKLRTISVESNDTTKNYNNCKDHDDVGEDIDVNLSNNNIDDKTSTKLSNNYSSTKKLDVNKQLSQIMQSIDLKSVLNKNKTNQPVINNNSLNDNNNNNNNNDNNNYNNNNNKISTGFKKKLPTPPMFPHTSSSRSKPPTAPPIKNSKTTNTSIDNNNNNNQNQNQNSSTISKYKSDVNLRMNSNINNGNNSTRFRSTLTPPPVPIPSRSLNNINNNNINNNNTNENKNKRSLLGINNYRIIPYSKLCEMNVDDGIDVMNKEIHLSTFEFQHIFKMPRNEFNKQPHWKKVKMKKEAMLF